MDFGAVADKEDTDSANINSMAFMHAFQAADNSDSDNEVYFPEGHKFYFMPAVF
jgi:hypothetical protein